MWAMIEKLRIRAVSSRSLLASDRSAGPYWWRGLSASERRLLDVALEERDQRSGDRIVGVVFGGGDVEVGEAFGHHNFVAARDATEGRKRRVRERRVDDARGAVTARRRAGPDAAAEGGVGARHRREAVRPAEGDHGDVDRRRLGQVLDVA